VKGVEFLFDLENLFYEALFGIVFVIPALRLCIRLGLPQALTLVLFVPVIGLPWFLWMVAKRPWPLVEEAVRGSAVDA
jgi:ABC-type Fe3+-siderophore transport system permease subunit